MFRLKVASILLQNHNEVTLILFFVGRETKGLHVRRKSRVSRTSSPWRLPNRSAAYMDSPTDNCNLVSCGPTGLRPSQRARRTRRSCQSGFRKRCGRGIRPSVATVNAYTAINYFSPRSGYRRRHNSLFRTKTRNE